MASRRSRSGRARVRLVSAVKPSNRAQLDVSPCRRPSSFSLSPLPTSFKMSTSTRQTVLVTGACGYIGSHVALTCLLSGKYRVVTIDK